jgi:RND superfamily putative drug exporter
MMGDWNWWLPGWLDRVLPHADFETDVTEALDEDREPAAV